MLLATETILLLVERVDYHKNPDDLFNGETTYTDLFDLVPTEESSSNIRNEFSNVSTDNQTNQIVEATGMGS